MVQRNGDEAQQPPQTVEELRARIVDLEPKLPKKLRDCASFVMHSGEEIAFLTVAQAAQAAQVQPSAMIRFSQTIGLSGYSDLQRIFRTAKARRPDYLSRVQSLQDNGSDSTTRLLDEFVSAAHHSLGRLHEELDHDALELAVQAIVKAERVFIAGYRRSYPVASYLTYVLGQFGKRVELDTASGAMDGPRSFDKNEAVVIISFEPYAEKAIEIAQRASESAGYVVVLTDTALSPLRTLADACLQVAEAEVGAFRSFSATFCLASTLAVAVGGRL
jgi:DNA-binding MurR/RpiR family transcriptional regulator